MSLLPPPLLSSSSISTLGNNNDDILFNSLFGNDNNDDNMTMAPPPPPRKKRALTKPVTADCVGVCKSVLGEGCVASFDEGDYTVELRPAGGNVLAAFISLCDAKKGVVHFCRRRDADLYQKKTFSNLQVLRNILTKHFLPCASSSAGDAFS